MLRLCSVLAAAGLAAFAAAPAGADTPAALQSFAAPSANFNLPSGFDNGSPLMRDAFGAPSFAVSTLLSPNLSLDGGRNLDIASRFDDYSGQTSPFLSVVTAPYLALANGGKYAGFTYTPSSDLSLRFGASLNGDWLNHITLDPYADNDPALGYRGSFTRSLMAGLSWNITDFAGIGLDAISSSREGVPLGFASGIPTRSSTDAVSMSARLGLGDGWVTKLSYSAGLSQLDLRATQASIDEKSYAISIAKRGLFGDDTVGFALSRPAPSLIGSFAGLATSTDLPPMVIARGADQHLARTPETDFQLGYVTNFLDGALALQANAAYQMNYQGQTGATAVSLLSRAKIKF